MEVHFTPEQQAQRAQSATKEGNDAERLVEDAVLRRLQKDAAFTPGFRDRLETRPGVGVIAAH